MFVAYLGPLGIYANLCLDIGLQTEYVLAEMWARLATRDVQNALD